jgi:hypothetical protein
MSEFLHQPREWHNQLDALCLKKEKGRVGETETAKEVYSELLLSSTKRLSTSQIAKICKTYLGRYNIDATLCALDGLVLTYSETKGKESFICLVDEK